MKIKYNRTSTLSQNGDRFLVDTDEYDLVLFDQVSGMIPFNERPESLKLVNLVNEGVVNTVVFEEVSRIARNTVETIQVLNFLTSRGVNVVIRNMGIQSRLIDGSKNPIWDILTVLLSSVSSMEREGIRLRCEQGRKMARLKGIVKFGRPVGSNENEKTFMAKEKIKSVVKLLEKGRSIREICKIVGISSKTVVKTNKIYKRHSKIKLY